MLAILLVKKKLSIKTVPDAVLADATVVSSGRPIHLTPRHRKGLRALTNGKCGNGELWVADTSHT